MSAATDIDNLGGEDEGGLRNPEAGSNATALQTLVVSVVWCRWKRAIGGCARRLFVLVGATGLLA